MSGKFLENSILLRSTDSVVDVVSCGSCVALVTEQNTVKEIDILSQKQIRSWSSNCWDIFTCGAVKDTKSNILYAVTNHSIVWRWMDTEESLDSVKKVTFKTEIKKLLIIRGTIWILFKTGFLQLWEDATASKKAIKRQIIADNETILQIKLVSTEKYAILAVGKDGSQRRVYVVDKESSFIIPALTINIKDKKICQCSMVEKQLITLYSNGDIYMKNIFQPDVPFPGARKDKLTLVNTSKDVNIMEAGDHAVFQGRAADDEGDYLILWNYKYSRQVDEKRIKMSLDTPMGWSLNEGLALMEGHTLGHVFLELKRTTAAAMWGIGAKGRKKNVENLSELPISEKKSGSDNMSVESVNGMMANQDLVGVLEWLKKCPFVLENVFVSVLASAMDMADEIFDSIPKLYFGQNLAYRPGITVTDEGTFKGVKLPYSYNKFKYICLLLRTPYTRSDLIIEINELNLESCEKLLEHLLCMVNVIKNSLSPVENLNLNIVNDLIEVVWLAKGTELMSTHSEHREDLLKRSFKVYQLLNAETTSLLAVEFNLKFARRQPQHIKAQSNSSSKWAQLDAEIIADF